MTENISSTKGSVTAAVTLQKLPQCALHAVNEIASGPFLFRNVLARLERDTPPVSKVWRPLLISHQHHAARSLFFSPRV